MIKKILSFLVIALLFSSCVSKKKILYLQNIQEVKLNDDLTYTPVFKADDALVIIVSSPDAPDAAVDFNLPAITVMGSNTLPPEIAQTQLPQQAYLVDKNGYVQLPIIGSFKIGGLTREQAIENLKKSLASYLKNPIVNIRIVNFKVSVLGEVAFPKEVVVNSERITLLEALSKAGDLTIYGDRSRILVVREIDGKKTYNIVDITKADFMNSPFYYLTQNDLVYVEPNKTRVNSSVVGPNISLIISGASVVLSVIVALILR